MKKIIIYTDGGSRGNPGQSAVGVVFCNENNQKVKEFSECIGEGTNNVAEYQAVIFAFKKFKAVFGKELAKAAEIEMRSDSELMVSQLNGKYKIMEENMQKLFIEAWNLKLDFGKVKFSLIPREKNKEADRLVNEALDCQAKSQKLI